MGIGLWLEGTPSDFGRDGQSGEFLDRVAAWFTANAGEPLEHVRSGSDHQGRPGTFISLHPAAEELEVLVPEAGQVIATVKTSTVGPGFHIYVCDLLKRLGEDMSIRWLPPDDEEGTGDETGYFERADRSAVETAMLHWLAAVMKDSAENHEGHSQMISMSMGHFYPYPAPLVTPVGPRDRIWQVETVADPRNGIDIFPWWSPGVGADFYLGRALCRMWQDVRWRVPLMDREATVLERVHQDLSRAFEIDPCRSYPFREWHELIQYLKSHNASFDRGRPMIESEVERRSKKTDDRPLIGYRRTPVRAYLAGGWSIEISGAMAEEWDEDGNWSAWDGERTVWFTAFSRKNDDGTDIPAAAVLDAATEPEGEQVEFVAEQVRGRAAFRPYEENGDELWNLKARVAVEGALGICNIYFHKPDDRDWALATWKSIHHG